MSGARIRPGSVFVACFAILVVEVAVLGSQRAHWTWLALAPSAIAAALLSIPQVIALSAAAHARDRFTAALGWTCAMIAFGYAILVAYDVFTATASTAGVGLFLAMIYGSVAVVGVLLLGSALRRIGASRQQGMTK